MSHTLPLDDAQLLSEVEDLIRTMPPRATLRHQTDENLAWFGRARALVGAWNGTSAPVFCHHVDNFIGDPDALRAGTAYPKLMAILHEARFDLRMKTTGPLSVVVNRGQPFDYFDEVRKVIAAAQSDLLFVDPYLDADFVSRYMPHIRSGVTIRLLTSRMLPVLLPAVDQFAQQHNVSVEVRTPGARPHDRYVFVDKAQCYLSSASFKDGGRLSPATLQQIADTFVELSRIYEAEWASAAVTRRP
jgi:hypothetical protein